MKTKKEARIAKTKQTLRKQNSGITLVALVITIVVLIILSTVSINAVFSEDGIIRKAELARDFQANAIKADEEDMNRIMSEYNNATAEPSAPILVEGISLSKATERIGEQMTLVATIEPDNASNKSIKWSSSNENILKVNENGIVTRVSETSKGTVTITASSRDGSEKNATCIVEVNPLLTTVTDTNHETLLTVDRLGNVIKIPGGFKIAEESGETVKEGIVVEDESGNQFVWIPVSNINHNGSNKIKIDETNEVEITLGRYTFDVGTQDSTTSLFNGTGAVSTTAGTYQYAVNYTSTLTLKKYHQELSTFRESTQAEDKTGKNATAKDLAGFVSSVSTNKGYYIGRYEASYASGSTFGVGNNSAYYKPATKVSTTATENSWTPSASTVGYLWNYITQGNASKACRQMYYGNSYVESDLVNSYAWDTAIVYIQEMGNSRYSCANNVSTGNKSLRNTGTTKVTGETLDEKCKIFDMVSNTEEWTTEYCTSSIGDYFTPCTCRGGRYSYTDCTTSSRAYSDSATRGWGIAFRPVLYCKTGT